MGASSNRCHPPQKSWIFGMICPFRRTMPVDHASLLSAGQVA
jgi:hypothetical protein